jgi:hypothetical protein
MRSLSAIFPAANPFFPAARTTLMTAARSMDEWRRRRRTLFVVAPFTIWRRRDSRSIAATVAPSRSTNCPNSFVTRAKSDGTNGFNFGMARIQSLAALAINDYGVVV